MFCVIDIWISVSIIWYSDFCKNMWNLKIICFYQVLGFAILSRYILEIEGEIWIEARRGCHASETGWDQDWIASWYGKLNLILDQFLMFLPMKPDKAKIQEYADFQEMLESFTFAFRFRFWLWMHGHAWTNLNRSRRLPATLPETWQRPRFIILCWVAGNADILKHFNRGCPINSNNKSKANS